MTLTLMAEASTLDGAAHSCQNAVRKPQRSKHTIGLHVISIGEVSNQGPHLRLGISQMLDGNSGVWSETSIGHNTQHKWIAGGSHSWRRGEVELLAHSQCGVPTLVVVQSAGGQILDGDVVEERGGVVENGISIGEVVGLGV